MQVISRTVVNDQGGRVAPERTGPDHERSTAPDEVIAAVSGNVARLKLSLNRIRERYLAQARHDVEYSTDLLISCIAAHGPMRSSALAEMVRSDPSTISRQVAALVRDGYVERRADPSDGRAALLAVTPAGQWLHQEHHRKRDEHYRELLASWSDEDLERFATLLGAFVDDLEAYQIRNGRFGEPGPGGPSREETR
jgi:DNA-binding MarR family transcriptional regulator